jgi:hypothetical protein
MDTIYLYVAQLCCSTGPETRNQALTPCTGYPNTHAALSPPLSNLVDTYSVTALCSTSVLKKDVETVLLLILCNGFPNTHAARSAQLQRVRTNIFFLYTVQHSILRTKVVENVLLLILCTGFANTHAARSAQSTKGVDQYPFTEIVLRFRTTHQVHMLDSQLYLNLHLCPPCMFPFASSSFCRSSEVRIGFRVATLKLCLWLFNLPHPPALTFLVSLAMGYCFAKMGVPQRKSGLLLHFLAKTVLLRRQSPKPCRRANAQFPGI